MSLQQCHLEVVSMIVPEVTEKAGWISLKALVVLSCSNLAEAAFKRKRESWAIQVCCRASV